MKLKPVLALIIGVGCGLFIAYILPNFPRFPYTEKAEMPEIPRPPVQPSPPSCTIEGSWKGVETDWKSEASTSGDYALKIPEAYLTLAPFSSFNCPTFDRPKFLWPLTCNPPQCPAEIDPESVSETATVIDPESASETALKGHWEYEGSVTEDETKKEVFKVVVDGCVYDEKGTFLYHINITGTDKISLPGCNQMEIISPITISYPGGKCSPPADLHHGVRTNIVPKQAEGTRMPHK